MKTVENWERTREMSVVFEVEEIGGKEGEGRKEGGGEARSRAHEEGFEDVSFG